MPFLYMLRGPTKITLDAKGRVSIPTKYRERIAARCNGQLICTVDQRSCLLIYPLPDWEETERKLMRLPSLNSTAQKLRGLLMGYATELELIVSKAMKDAKLKESVKLLASPDKQHLFGSQATIWNHEPVKELPVDQLSGLGLTEDL